MKKLNKKNEITRNTVELYYCNCSCSCNCWCDGIADYYYSDSFSVEYRVDQVNMYNHYAP